MRDESEYRQQAETCRQQASVRPGDTATRDIWLRFAAEYDRLAEGAAAMARRAAQTGSWRAAHPHE